MRYALKFIRIVWLLIDDMDNTAADQLDAIFCEPLYQRNATLASAVSAAIASSTPIAIQATKGKDAAKLKNYPQCAVSQLLFLPRFEIVDKIIYVPCYCRD